MKPEEYTHHEFVLGKEHHYGLGNDFVKAGRAAKGTRASAYRFHIPKENVEDFHKAANSAGLVKGKHYHETMRITPSQHTEQPTNYLEHLKQGGLPHEYKGCEQQ